MSLNSHLFAPSVAASLCTGRDDQVQEFSRALESARPVVLVYGPHASGKSVLAARGLYGSHDFREPVRVHISLAEHVYGYGGSPSASFEHDFRAQLGLRDSNGPRTFSRPVSVVIDAAELLIAPAGQELASSMARLREMLEAPQVAVTLLTHVSQNVAEHVGLHESLKDLWGAKAHPIEARPLSSDEVRQVAESLGAKWSSADAEAIRALTGGWSGLVFELARAPTAFNPTVYSATPASTEHPLADYFKGVLRALAQSSRGFKLLDTVIRKDTYPLSLLTYAEIVQLDSWSVARLRGDQMDARLGAPVITHWVERLTAGAASEQRQAELASRTPELEYGISPVRVGSFGFASTQPTLLRRS